MSEAKLDLREGVEDFRKEETIQKLQVGKDFGLFCQQHLLPHVGTIRYNSVSPLFQKVCKRGAWQNRTFTLH